MQTPEYYQERVKLNRAKEEKKREEASKKRVSDLLLKIHERLLCLTEWNVPIVLENSLLFPFAHIYIEDIKHLREAMDKTGWILDNNVEWIDISTIYKLKISPK